MSDLAASASINPNAVADILGDAFRNDPVVGWTTAHPAYPRFSFGATLEAFTPYDGLFIDEQETAAALWLPPGQRMASPVRFGTVVSGLAQFGPAALVRALLTLSVLDKLKFTEPHYYLFAIGSREAARGQGRGAAIMRRLLALADRDGMPVCLENSNPLNHGFYSSFGFRAVDTRRLPRNGPPIVSMIRDAR